MLVAAVLLLCAAASWSISQFGWDHSARVWLPMAFVVFVLVLGARYGRVVGMLGTLVAAIIFAHSLYRPVGSLAVEDQTARQVLAWTVLIGVSVSFLVLPTNSERRR